MEEYTWGERNGRVQAYARGLARAGISQQTFQPPRPPPSYKLHDVPCGARVDHIEDLEHETNKYQSGSMDGPSSHRAAAAGSVSAQVGAGTPKYNGPKPLNKYTNLPIPIPNEDLESYAEQSRRSSCKGKEPIRTREKIGLAPRRRPTESIQNDRINKDIGNGEPNGWRSTPAPQFQSVVWRQIKSDLCSPSHRKPPKPAIKIPGTPPATRRRAPDGDIVNVRNAREISAAARPTGGLQQPTPEIRESRVKLNRTKGRNAEAAAVSRTKKSPMPVAETPQPVANPPKNEDQTVNSSLDRGPTNDSSCAEKGPQEKTSRSEDDNADSDESEWEIIEAPESPKTGVKKSFREPDGYGFFRNSSSFSYLKPLKGTVVTRVPGELDTELPSLDDMVEDLVE